MIAIVVEILGGLLAVVAGVGPAIVAFVHERREHSATAVTHARELIAMKG